MTTTKSADVLEMLKQFFMRHFNWQKHLSTLCTDGAPALLGNKSGFAGLVKKEASGNDVIHCFLLCHVLASKTLPPSLKSVLATAVQVITVTSSEPEH